MIHVYPGMGATGAMYSGAWRKLPDAIFHDWPSAFSGNSITDIAEELIRIHEIKIGDTLIGSSLGGIIASEIANQIQLAQLVLIGSALHPDEISKILRLLHPIIDYTPLRFIQFATSSIPNELSSMFAKSNPDFIRNMCRAIFQWEGLTSNVVLTRIHGCHDHVIPHSGRDTHLIESGHLIAISHAQDCVDIVENLLP